ncbi:MAG: Smr/MutS family protein [Desulfococcaceae bacterium]
MKRAGKKLSDDYGYRPFEDLRHLIENRNIRLAEIPCAPPLKQSEKKSFPENEHQLFAEAMSDVVPVSWENCGVQKQNPPQAVRTAEDTGSETLSMLKNLVVSGEGFIVSDTPEYMDGRGYNISPEIPMRLHRGDFSVQDHIDLHGLNAFAAREVFEDFLKRSVSEGKRTVLIVHGRGLSSPVMPVLKNRICQWLTTGPWRKWVMAFASARACDGGAGATYVLLRCRPATKRYRKKHRRVASDLSALTG